MGLIDRKKSGNKLDSKILVTNQNVVTSKVQPTDKLVIKNTKINGNN